MPRGPAGGDDPLREQLSALRGLLVLSMLLTRQDDQAGILHLVASAVESLGHCRTERIRLDGQWTEVRAPHHEQAGGDLDGSIPPDGVRFELAGVPWSWAYSMSSPRGPSGCLVVGAEQEPTESERFLLQVLAQQAGVALANARLHTHDREQAEQLRVTNLALQRTMEIHDRLTRVVLEGQGQEGIAQAVYELTGYPAAIEDRFGNLLAWAGPGRPDSYPKDTPRRRGSLLRRAIAARGPIRDGKRLFSVALLGRAAVGVLVVNDPDGKAEEAERVAIELVRTLSQADGLLVSEGTIYPLLSRLRRAHLVSTSWQESEAGPPRRYYQLTDAGQRALADFSDEWARFRDSVDALLTTQRAMNVHTDPQVDDYLRRLDAAAAALPAHRREELVAEIRDHLQEALRQAPASDKTAVRNVLERLGPPEEIAAAAADSPPSDQLVAPFRETNGSAIVAVVLGVLWFAGIGSVLALVFGYRARREIKNSAGTQKGSGLATAAIILGWIGIAVLVAAVAAGLAVMVVAAGSSGGGPVPVHSP
jgi:DNA-binding PadR family transcriptional regulator